MRQDDRESASFAWELLPGEEVHQCPDCGPLRRVVEADPDARYGLVLREWHTPDCILASEPAR